MFPGYSETQVYVYLPIYPLPHWKVYADAIGFV